MSLLNVIDRISEHKPRSFVAPIPDAGVVKVFTLQDNIPYQFKFRSPKPGWYIVEPTSKSTARLGEEAQPCDILAYLEELPRFYVIAVCRLAKRTWLCVPYNVSDAAQREWARGEPKTLHLIRHAIWPFDLIVARSLAGALLYDKIDNRLGEATSAVMARDILNGRHNLINLSNRYVNAFEILRRRQLELEKETREKELKEQRQTTEGRIRWELEFMGADLLGYNEAGEGYEVRWSFDGCEHTMRLRRDMRIESAGICLDRTDSSHNLSSIVSVMEESRRLRRFDLREDYYL